MAASCGAAAAFSVAMMARKSRAAGDRSMRTMTECSWARADINKENHKHNRIMLFALCCWVLAIGLLFYMSFLANRADDFTAKINGELLSAAESGSTEQIASLLDAGANVNSSNKDNDGLTALHLAAMRGHVDAVRILLARGANARARSSRLGQSPLHVAANAGCKAEIVEMLLEAGASVEDKDSDCRNVLEYPKNSEDCIGALHKRRMRNEVEQARRQLERDDGGGPEGNASRKAHYTDKPTMQAEERRKKRRILLKANRRKAVGD